MNILKWELPPYKYAGSLNSCARDERLSISQRLLAGAVNAAEYTPEKKNQMEICQCRKCVQVSA